MFKGKHRTRSNELGSIPVHDTLNHPCPQVSFGNQEKNSNLVLDRRPLRDLREKVLNHPDASASRLPRPGRVDQAQVKVTHQLENHLVHLHKGQALAETLPSARATEPGYC